MRKPVIYLAIIVILAIGVPLMSQTTITRHSSMAKPTVADAEKFMNQTEALLMDLNIKAGRTAWVQANFITDDTETITAEENERLIEAMTKIVPEIKKYDGLQMPPGLARKFLLLKLQLFSLSNAKEREEFATLASGLEGSYGKGKACIKEGKSAGKCLPIGDVEKVFSDSRDPEELKQVWTAWHEVGMVKDSSGKTMRERYQRYIELQNKGAQEMGYKDMGAMWRAGYDMSPEQFSAEVERIWNQVRPLYDSLHAYARTQLIKNYGPHAVTKEGLIRADLLGNPWAQQWNNVYPLLAPPTTAKGYDLTEILQEKKIDELGMVHYGENFFKSLGFAPLPQSFWERSLFIKPRDREVVCHASAWSIDFKDDLRLKMCILIRDEDFVTVHHELGHNFYQRAYNKQPFLFQNGANDGFHEAIGDTVALSITPEYLKQVGLLETVPETDDTALLMKRALDKVAFLPFGLLIDQWRWKVFSGEIAPVDYNKAWWQLREKYQGIAPPAVRTENDFDPGAKYHVPAGVPYTRYFLAAVLQFQFYRAMCREAGYSGPLHRCSFYGNKAAGEKLATMLEMGQSQPWPVALKTLTGEDRMDGGAMMEYFAPLKKWLDEQNAAANAKPGWTLPADPLAGPSK